MQTFDLSDTQPTRGKNIPPAQDARKKRIFTWFLWVLFAGLVILLMSLAGVYAGYRSALQTQEDLEATQSVLSIQEQFALGLEEFQAGEYDLARQRFEYVLSKDPAFPSAADRLAEVMQILFATATPTPITPTPTPSLTPTPDLRPVEELFNQAKGQYIRGDWAGAIESLVNLRKVDPTYRVAEADGILYIALRSRGIDKIKGADLEGGSYDLALAERFGPLDAEAQNYRELARLYMFGSAFWEAFPERAVYFFGQLASAAPGLRDASGWTARERYRSSLIHYGDQLARSGDWCGAQAQYALAQSIRADAAVVPTAVYAENQCFTPTPTATEEMTETPTPTLTPTWLPSPTFEASPTPTDLPTSTVTPEVTVAPPSETPTLEVQPTSTDTPTLEPELPTETPTPEALLPTTDTPTPEPSPGEGEVP